MKRIILLAVVGLLTLGGWAMAQKQELLDHSSDSHMQQMDDGTCTPPSNPPPGQ